MDKSLNYLMIGVVVLLVLGMLAKSMVAPPTCTPSPAGCIPIPKS